MKKNVIIVVVLLFLFASVTIVVSAFQSNVNITNIANDHFSFDLKQNYTCRQDVINELNSMGKLYKEYTAANKDELSLKNAKGVLDQNTAVLVEKLKQFPDLVPDLSKQFVDKIDSLQEGISLNMDELQSYDLSNNTAKKNLYDKLKVYHDQIDVIRSDFKNNKITLDEGNKEIDSLTFSVSQLKSAD
jgi:hypothetical protein